MNVHAQRKAASSAAPNLLATTNAVAIQDPAEALVASLGANPRVVIDPLEKDLPAVVGSVERGAAIRADAACSKAEALANASTATMNKDLTVVIRNKEANFAAVVVNQVKILTHALVVLAATARIAPVDTVVVAAIPTNAPVVHEANARNAGLS